MKSYNLDYNIHSLFEREKSNNKLKERLGNIRSRKNLFLPNINPLIKSQSNNNNNTSNEICQTSPNKISIKDYGKIKLIY